MVNLGSAILCHARTTPDRTAIVYEGHRISYAELTERFGAVASLLLARGVKPNERVAVLMKNSAAFIEIALAASHIGAVFLPINFRLAADEVAYIVANSGASLMFADAEFAAAVAGLPDVIIVDTAAQRDASTLAPGGAIVPAPVVRTPDDLYRLMYTSGTTDHPKGVMHSYANTTWKAISHIITLGLGAEDRLAVVGPLYHVGAFDLPGLSVLLVGGMICILRDFDPVETVRLIEREHISGIWLAPVMMNAIIDQSATRGFNLASLRWCVAGGERSVESKIRQFSGLFVNARFIDAYGLTESCSGDTFMPAGRELDKIGSVGCAVPYLQIRICDEDGRSLPAGIAGEICLRGPKVTKGYWRNAEKTKASFFGDWFRTGDVGVLDEEDFLTITDRAKDMIISGGENIASSEVERVAYQLPQISEAAVVGLPDPKWGERAVLVAVLHLGTSLDLAEVTRFCRARLAPFKVPKELHLRAALPRNPSGKILKRVLRDELCAARAGLPQSSVGRQSDEQIR